MGTTSKGVAGGLATLDGSAKLAAAQVPGSIGATGVTGDLTVTAGDVVIATAGKGLKVKEGSNATMGVATLVTGTVVVATTKVTATSRIQLTAQSLGTVTAP